VGAVEASGRRRCCQKFASFGYCENGLLCTVPVFDPILHSDGGY
jgi:hypothetical protein